MRGQTGSHSLLIEEVKGFGFVTRQLREGAAPCLHRRDDVWGGRVVLHVNRRVWFFRCGAGWRAEEPAETEGRGERDIDTETHMQTQAQQELEVKG